MKTLTRDKKHISLALTLTTFQVTKVIIQNQLARMYFQNTDFSILKKNIVDCFRINDLTMKMQYIRLNIFPWVLKFKMTFFWHKRNIERYFKRYFDFE